jgi:hypothetical protein
VGRLLDPGVSDLQIETEARHVGDHRNSTAIQGWVQGLRLLRPLARDGARAGIRIAHSDTERQAARLAYRALSRSAEMYRGFTSIELYRGMAAAAACDESEAREALAWAAYSGETRETALLGLELALRFGDANQVAAARARVAALMQNHESAGDRWLLAIADELDARCP